MAAGDHGDDGVAEDPKQLKRRIRDIRRSRTYYQLLANRLRNQLASSTKQLATLKKGLKKSENDVSHFTTHGGMTLAVRASISRASSYSIGLSMGVGVHPGTVVVWEIKMRAAGISAMRAWYREMYDHRMQASSEIGPGEWSIEFHEIRCDASSPKNFHGKLHVIETTSGFICRSVCQDDEYNTVLIV